VEELRKDIKKRSHRSHLKGLDERPRGRGVQISFEDDRLEGVSHDVKKVMKYRSRTVESLEQFWVRRCEHCKAVKPLRTHHCNVCNRCVFLMDHHCRNFIYN